MQPCVTDSIFYTRKNDGGPGIFIFKKLVLHARPEHWATMIVSNHVILRGIAKLERKEKGIKNYCELLELN